jgi:hypothetical protein
MMNRAHTLQMAAPVPLRKSPIVLWSGTSWPVSHIRFAAVAAGRKSVIIDLSREGLNAGRTGVTG